MSEFAILSDLDGTLIDSKGSVRRAFEWWAELRGLDPAVADRIPYGRTSTDAASVLAPHLDPVVESALIDERQQQDTAGVMALPGARTVLTRGRVAIVTSCPLPLAKARLAASSLPTPSTLVTPEQWTHGKPHPEPYLVGAASVNYTQTTALRGLRLDQIRYPERPCNTTFFHAGTRNLQAVTRLGW